MVDRHGPINVNVNVSQANNQTNQGPSADNNGCLGCVGVLGVVMIVGLIGKAFEASPILGSLLVAVIVLSVVFLIVGKVSAVQDKKRAAAAAEAAQVRAAEVRADIESRATVDAIGGCMWCGHPGSHRAENGHAVHPRDWHAVEVDDAVRVAVEGTGSSPSAPTGTTRPPQPPAPSAPLPVPRHPAGMPRTPHPGSPGREARLHDQLRYDQSGECRWCGSPTEHRNETGRIIHPAKVHRAEYEAERDAAGGAPGH